ncbi:TPA: hypothetical protein ACG2IX_000461 [Escherichia coli]
MKTTCYADGITAAPLSPQEWRALLWAVVQAKEAWYILRSRRYEGQGGDPIKRKEEGKN